MILFSVIIPHYNSSKTLKRLLESIPVDESVELIVIDDKSSEDLTEAKDLVLSRGGTFLHNTTDRKGAGVCRNLGLEVSTGKWLVFADADDYFIEGAFDVLRAHADSKSDIIYFSPISRYENNGAPAKRHIPYKKFVKHYVKSPSERNEMILRYKFMTPWSRMIRRQLVMENKIYFDEIPASNDVMFSMRTAYYANLISASLEQIYCITSAANTLTTKRDEQNYWARVETFVNRYNFMHDNLESEKYNCILPTGLLVIIRAAKQKYNPAFIRKIYVYLKQNNIKILSLKTLCLTGLTTISNRQRAE